jgi:hypothetical protein
MVGSVKQAGLTDDAAQGAAYYLYICRPESNVFVAVRSGVRPESLAMALQRAARRIDPDLAVNGISRWTTGLPLAWWPAAHPHCSAAFSQG